jgi:tRNA(Ile)-lysidine synthase
VAAALRRAGYSGNHITLVVAASGGPDSSALLHGLRRLKDSHRLKLHVAHLNHNFRGEEADADARFVSSQARELGLPSTVEKQDPLEYQRRKHISSFEQAAREMRYAFLAGVARDVGATAVALGHTADDQAETVLLHVLRGSGLHGLRGMTELSPWPWPGEGWGPPLFRPLLAVTKADTVGYCRALGRDFREDSGNYLPGFTRNRVRHQLLPLLASEYNPRVRESLVRLARTASLNLEYLEGEVDRAWPQVAVEDDGCVNLKLSALAALHPGLQRMLLRRGYAVLMGDTRRLRESHLTAMAALIAGQAAGRTVELPGGAKLQRAYDYLLLFREASRACPLPQMEGEHSLVLPSAVGRDTVRSVGGWRVTLRAVESPQPVPEKGGQGGIPPPGSVCSEWLDRASLGDQLSVRTRRPGDRFRPLGMSQEKKLQDFFTDLKVPRLWRDRVPLLVSDRGIAWVVGYRIADWARMEAMTSPGRPVVWVEFEPRS